MRQTRFILVRHGETRWNTGELLQGHSDVPLSEEGVAQAEAVAAALKHYPMDAIIASPLSRALVTARAIAAYHPGIPFSVRPELMEQSFGLWEGKHYSEAVTMYRDGSWEQTWNNPGCPPPKGESLHQVADRVRTLLADTLAAYGGSTVTLVSHGVAIRVLLREMLGLPFPHLNRIRLANTAITMVDWDGKDTGELVFVNNTMHLPEEPKDT